MDFDFCEPCMSDADKRLDMHPRRQRRAPVDIARTSAPSPSPSLYPAPSAAASDDGRSHLFVPIVRPLPQVRKLIGESVADSLINAFEAFAPLRCVAQKFRKPHTGCVWLL